MKQIALKPEVLNTFSQLISEQFTVDHATKAYLSKTTCTHITKKKARQFIYRNMVRLMSTGELEKLNLSKGWPQYRFTEKFRLVALSVNTSPIDKAEVIPLQITTSANLTERLNLQKIELLTAMGEVEEYDSICREIPTMRTDIQSLYNESRDKCSKILGRVKALERVISLGVI
jgi:transcriptional regulator with PAS, ATPase and Fis domain